jgi:hypothetical protein
LRLQQWTGVSMDMGLVVFGTSTDTTVGSGDRSGADVCIWLRTPFGWKTEFVSGNCVVSPRVYTVDDEDIRSSGLVQVNDGLYAEVPLWCSSGPTARRRIDLVCLEASVGRLPQEVLLEESYRSECSETVRVGRVRVFEELLAVFNCSILTFVVQ